MSSGFVVLDDAIRGIQVTISNKQARRSIPVADKGTLAAILSERNRHASRPEISSAPAEKQGAQNVRHFYGHMCSIAPLMDERRNGQKISAFYLSFGTNQSRPHPSSCLTIALVMRRT